MTAFLCYLVVAFMVFFASVDNVVNKNTVELLRSNVQQQSYHFEAVIDLQFNTLEVAASYIGMQPQRLTLEQMEDVLQSLSSTDTFGRTMLILPDGTGYTSDGVTTQVKDRAYFTTAMSGKRALSNPISSSVDGDNKVVLAVPVRRNGEVTAVLGGSYDVGALSNLLFADIYDGKGYSFIVTADGSVVSSGTTYADWSGRNSFDAYGKVKYSKGSLEQMREDFQERSGGSIIVDNQGVGSYLAYEPLDCNDWVLCYVVSEEDAKASYVFITHYELLLGLAFLAGVGALLLTMQRLNARDRRRLMQKAEEDPLTGLLNKESTARSITDWLNEERCKGFQVLLMVDLDHFKEINDTYGHATGDLVLKKAAQVLRGVFRETDIVGRVGGDEFMVFLKNVGNPEVVQRLMSTLNSRIRAVTVDDLPEETLSCSIGAAFYPRHGKDFTLLYENADRALYEAKRAGRNGHAVFESGS
ncbi:MAG: diguanylate cyclase [Pseudoflavonifractor capillosus]|uniref:sensor domain-containing diguanylate cyclase n=1 Tax=Pseudoflavonifractor capillosus TaxID=106588 RepID=UPI0023F775D2|nr:sensor domain-containing diguanylate cyclase [Pseudoflavonifractor capillosus]MCI5927252.1 diguanylate cyclase [Pseudoflavonifractor capillosus]